MRPSHFNEYLSHRFSLEAVRAAPDGDILEGWITDFNDPGQRHPIVRGLPRI